MTFCAVKSVDALSMLGRLVRLLACAERKETLHGKPVIWVSIFAFCD
jgi:hypothetical protein